MNIKANKIKEKANKMRAMSDEELVAYVENRDAKARSEGYNQGFSLRQRDIDKLTNQVIDMRNYSIDIGSSIEYNHYDDLICRINDICTLTTKLNRR